ncbi:TIGR02281 family clan AA aspartic protease [Halomonas sp. SSL-5]|uniref:retropepsin-like aspartic protease family protein n=1 Tax=Halomonas sp. SSL-5 TaxID=3065855 RepID=UPI0027385CEB|nr:TIGR02281 family clan AA aspartic protease [Halomonas sp. SSL-5]MDY7114801.1 TIGR02281 family clan AA aspartic protease [Halomonas sp. SSL-5]
MSDEGRAVRRTGLGMMLLFWLLFIAAGTWWFHGYVERQRNPNSHLVSAMAEGEPLVLQRNRGGHFVATGRINGEPVEFLVDTGATYVALPREMAERLGLEPSGGAWFNTANGRVRGALTTLDEVSLGGYVARDVRGSISPGLEGDIALLGMSFLDRFDIRIRDARMVLEPAEGW